MAKIDQMFGIDLRSLAAFRIGAALTILVDLVLRSRDLGAYFTDDGIMPRVARLELYELSDEFGTAGMWSLHLFSGQHWAQVLLFILAGVAAVCLLVGYRTRWAAVASWVLLQSLDARNPMLINSGDVLLRSMLFWSLFLPLGARFSLDRLWGASVGTTSQRVCSSASFALLGQLSMMYFFSALFKSHPAWTTELSAVYYALNCDAYMTSVGLWARELPAWIHQALTLGTYVLELLGGIVVFLPWRTNAIRTATILAFWSFHLGLLLTMTIGLFPAICMLAWFVFIPGTWWDAAARWLPSAGRLATDVSNRLTAWGPPRLNPGSTAGAAFSPEPRMTARFANAVMNLLVLAVFAYTILWNIRELNFKTLEPVTMGRQYNLLGRALGIDQNWSMFSPIPRTEDGWVVMRGVLRDGTEVNLWDFDKPLPWEKPALVSATYKTQRWRKYLDNLTTEPYGMHRIHFANWLQQRWNREMAGDQKEREVVEVKLIHRLEITPPPGTPIPEPDNRVLLTWYYE